MFSELDPHSCLKLGRGTLDLNTACGVCSPQGDFQEAKWYKNEIFHDYLLLLRPSLDSRLPSLSDHI